MKRFNYTREIHFWFSFD